MNIHDQPLVSVVIPCYNHVGFVQKSIQSVIDQLYVNIELIIIDDGSSDGSIEKILQMKACCEKRFKRFEVRSRTNKGVSSTLNEGLEWCEGTFISLLASDDYYQEKKIINQVNFLAKNTDFHFVVSDAYVVNDLDEILELQTSKYNLALKEEITFDDIFIFKTHLPITGLYTTELLKEKLNGFDPNVTAEDYEIYLKIAQLTKIGIMHEELYYYRSPEAIGGDRQRMPIRLDVSESHLMIIKKYADHPLYYKALQEWNFRRFIFFSSYKSTKIYALSGMFGSLNKVVKPQFLKSLFKLFFIWK